MQRLSIVTALVISILFVAQMAQATTYYVATTGSDSYTTMEAQNTATPWLTMQRCLNLVVAGDTCLFAPGVYAPVNYAHTATSGTSGNPITLKSSTRYGANIVMTTVTNAANYGLRIDKSYYIIDGFDFSGAG